MSLNVDLIYLWFVSVEMFYKYPLKTQFNTLFDAFASAANPRIMHRPMLRTLELGSADIAENIQNSFGDSVNFCNTRIVRSYWW